MHNKDIEIKIVQIKDMIASDDILRAINLAMDLIAISHLNNNILLNESIQIKARYNRNQKDHINGIISKDDYNRYLNNIRYNLLELLDSISRTPSQTEESLHKTQNRFIDKTINYVSLLKAEKVFFKYKRTEFSLKNINLNLVSGEITGLVGENGNGKTTLFDLISGETKFDSGLISYPYFSSINIKGWEEIKYRIAYVKQELEPINGTLQEAIQFEAALHGVIGFENEQRCKYIINRLGLENYVSHTYSELSGGYRLRFHIAKCLSWKPNILILDEPLSNLDVETQRQFLTDIRDISNNAEYPMCIVISSQNLFEIEKVADKIIFLSKGESVFYDCVENIGKDRQFNIFEFSTHLSLRQVLDSLKDIQVFSIEENIFGYVLYCDNSISSSNILYKLLESNADIVFFKNISNSSKSIFVKNSAK